ncbi:ABC transporter ATP-binding protein [Acidaminobacter sp. JC074]|uniref:ABC transporter ATP-binding protein n=1 Tax=Acidaminobacter sp. JC074 TaxID=2530199 RepID=UPI001F0F9EC2|nr:ABC transporter ATP-binding protein [Acidaminobacter sp. JC074]MCH4886052.1 ABC transporter ATP-binding protein [Acidaminobacter sp. JC074]
MIKLENISKTFDKHQVIENFSMDIEDGQVICLLGPSGSGKTTILKMLSGLDTHFKGSIKGLEDKSVSYVFQESRLLPWLTVKENLLYVLEDKLPIDKIHDHIQYFLDQVGLSSFINAYPNTLSGGMKQRVSLARAFACPHDILLLDEPFQGLDSDLKEQLMSLLERLIGQDESTVIMVTHDLSEAFRLGDKVFRLIGQPITEYEEIIESLS